MPEGVHPVVALALSLYGGLWAHVLAHYLIGYLWTADQELELWYVFPTGVDYSSMSLPPRAYRYIGLAPLMLVVPLAVLFVVEIQPLLADGEQMRAAAHLPLYLATLPTWSDLEPLRSSTEQSTGVEV
ncbi:hypothetical protein BRC81_04550 [Halobacteriales archaeon QS_1_68_20]|nr:MAG: hypothetical protein BRC81_04550 [Halobacteriales archaeon QS_1_68_20]